MTQGLLGVPGLQTGLLWHWGCGEAPHNLEHPLLKVYHRDARSNLELASKRPGPGSLWPYTRHADPQDGSDLHWALGRLETCGTLVARPPLEQR